MPLDSLLTFFLKEHAHFALVVDEFGDSIGLVFLDDILEQIVGDDIQDEFDREEMREFVKTGKDTYAVNGAVTLFDLADYLPEMDLDCPGRDHAGRLHDQPAGAYSGGRGGIENRPLPGRGDGIGRQKDHADSADQAAGGTGGEIIPWRKDHTRT